MKVVNDNEHAGFARRKTARPARSAATGDVREFPDHPRVGVGGIVVHNAQVVLVRRGREPLKGRWSIPGGLVEVGEQLQQAVRREIKEETGLDVEPVERLEIFERIQRDPDGRGRIRYHYVIVDYVCRVRGSKPGISKPPALRPGSDVTEAEWVGSERLGLYRLSTEAEEIILKAMEFIDPYR